MNNLHSADQMTIRQLNTSLILNCLRYEPSLTRAQLAQKTGLNRSTVTNLVDDLIKQELVVETGMQPSRGGRPGIELALNPDGGASVGIEIKDTFATVVLTDFLANIVWHEKIEFPNPTKKIPFETLYPRIEVLIENALKQAEARNMTNVLGLGIAVTGLVNIENGESVYAPNLGWRNVPIKQIFEDRFKLPVFVGNGSSLSALSEWHYGISQSVQNLIYVASSHIGVGGGIFLNNQLYHGVSGYAGEIGHMVVNPDGDQCGCGRIGCWESEIGELHISSRIHKRLQAGEKSILSTMLTAKDDQEISLPMIVEAAHQQDALAIEALNRLIKMLALGVANLANIFNPQLIVLGGTFASLPAEHIEQIAELARQEVLGSSASDLKIAVGKLPMDEVCVIGAATLVLDDVLRMPIFNAIR